MTRHALKCGDNTPVNELKSVTTERFLKSDAAFRSACNSIAFVENKKRRNKHPDFDSFDGERALGAAWKGTIRGEAPQEFLRVEFDDPGIAPPLRAALFSSLVDSNALDWNRTASK